VTTWTADKVALEFQNAGFTNAYEHFSKYGWAEGVNPSNSFDLSSYFDAKAAATGKTVAEVKAAFAAAGLDPIAHYKTYGKSEGITVTEVPADEQVTPDSSGSTGQTFTLTTGIDALTGTAGNDTFVASSDGAATSTSNLGDSIDGGAGIDTVKIYSNAANTVIPNLTNVENLWIQDTVHESYNVSTIAGLTNLSLNSGTTVDGATITQTLGAGQSLTLSNITDGDTAAAALADGGISIAQAASITSLNLNLNAVGAQTAATANNALQLGLAGTGLNTLNVVATGTNNIGLANPGGALTTVNISGAGTTTVWGTTATTITTLDASAATGAVTVDLSASTGANQTVKGGSGNDTLTVDLARNITLDAGAGNDVVVLANATAANLSSTTGAADSIDGGAGTDTLSVLAAGAVALAGDTAADRAVIKNFEQLRVSDDLNGSTFSIANFGLNYLQIDAATTTAAATVNGFTSGATVEYRANADSTGANGQVNIGMTGATNAGTPDDLLNIKLNANLANQAAAADAIEFTAGISGINKLVITTADRDNTDGATARDDGYILNLANDNSLTQMTISGDRELSFTSTASTAALATVDASGLSGDLILNLAVNGLTQGVVVTGGSGANTITGTGFADTITGGARADVITGGAGADTLTGGAGADTFVFATGDTGITLATADVITDFVVGVDKLRLGAAATDQNTTINATAVADFAAAKLAADAAFNDGDLEYYVVKDATNTYVFVDNGADGNAAEQVIVLNGVLTLTTADIIA
jgi:Ca2+-binding RTX toxin-like protein